MPTPDTQAEARRHGLRSLLRNAAAKPRQSDSQGIVDRSLAFVGKLRARADAPISRERLEEVAALAQLLCDPDWQAPPSLEPRLLVALSHFSDACEVGPGALAEQAADLTQVLAEDLGDELQGFREFASRRAALERGRARDPALRAQLLTLRRRQIRARIQARRWRRTRPS